MGCMLLHRPRLLIVLPVFLAAAARHASAQDPSDAVYNENVVATYRLTISAADWNAIVNDPFGSGDQWKRCSFQWQSDAAVLDVGVKAVGTNRYAGNPKPAIRIKFDEFVPSREWRGVDNIKLEGNILEALTERVSYWTDRQFGVPAPRTSHATLYVNGAYKGVYTAVEIIRKKFVKYHFNITNPDGNLYKIDRKPNGLSFSGDHYLWRGPNPATYVPSIWEPITNETGGNYNDVVGLINILNNTAQAQRRAQLDGVMNLDKFYAYLALMAATGDYDSVLAGDAPSTPNNHQWYHREDTNRLQLIPWDRSNGFGATYWLDPTERVNMTLWFGIDPAVTSSTQWDGRSRTNTKMTAWIRPDLIAANTYLAKLRLLLNGSFPSSTGRVDFVNNQIKNLVYADPLKGQPPQSLTNAAYDARVTTMRNWVGSRRTNLLGQLPSNNAQFISHTVPTSMTAGQTATVTVTMKNTGTATWNGGGTYPYGLGHPAGSTPWTWRTNRVYLASGEAVAPNASKTFSFSITAPSSAGTYAFPTWQLVQEGIGYFGASIPALNITVGGGGGTTVTRSYQNGVAPTSTYAGTRDAYISESAPTTNYGSANPLLLDGDTTGGKDAYVLLRWDVTGIPAGSTVQSVRIKLYVTNTSTQTYEIYRLNRTWVETGATWNQAAAGTNWSVAGAKGSADRGSTIRGTVTGTAAGTATITLNASGVSLVQSWIDSPSGNYGLIFANSLNADSLQFASKEATTASQRPRLEVTYSASAVAGAFETASSEDLVDGEENPLTQEDAMNASDDSGDDGVLSGACGATGLEALLMLLAVFAVRKGGSR